MIEQIIEIKAGENLIKVQAIKLGIYATAGTKFYLNSNDMQHKRYITVGNYGIYELDFSNLNAYISWLSFEESWPQQYGKVIVDLIYQGGVNQ